MSNTLTAKEQSLSKVFSDDYVFTIPGYQRPYAWGTEQAQELFDVGSCSRNEEIDPFRAENNRPFQVPTATCGQQARAPFF